MTEARDRVLAATIASAGIVGMERITVEEVAREAGVSRATVYRWFPGGREQLVEEAVTWEVARFLARLGEAVADAPDLAARLELGLVFARHAIRDHEVLQRLLATEPEGVLPQLRSAAPLVLAVLRDYLVPLVAAEPLRDGVDPSEAAEVIARTFVSLVSSPGRYDLDDPATVSTLVRDRILAGVTDVTPGRR